MAMLFPQLIKANLQTKWMGRKIEYYQRLESTNLEAFELIDEGEPADGTVVITDLQLQGRGRRGRSWFSSPGKAVTFSVILRPELLTERSSLLSLAAGVAVAEAVEKFGLSPALKWPNDIRLSGRKCGGILVETRLHGRDVACAVLGIGVNVNERVEELPEELRTTATTLSAEKGVPLQRELVVAWTLNRLEPLIDELNRVNSEVVRSAWLKRCDHLNQAVKLTQDGEERHGKFSGITENGSAVIETENGVITLSGDEISLGT
ncbi:MAG: biotin--[acetyl-CoA-carboxylase] ligase [Candidatus Neomarinimicrobiota bacterium]|nr:biotin--[acetyl-CoA-carboxylase] ligase [Candidatus Neomarinimicrobiota bacterium]